jgi:hypothetical protein
MTISQKAKWVNAYGNQRDSSESLGNVEAQIRDEVKINLDFTIHNLTSALPDRHPELISHGAIPGPISR